MAVADTRLIRLQKTLTNRIVILDGAMGTSIQDHDLSASDFGGEDLYGCNENLVISCPSIVKDIHCAFMEAGADILETNTFGGTALVLDEFGIGAKAEAINVRAVELAREAADIYSTDEQPRFVAGSIGPTTKAITVIGGATFDELEEQFYQQALALSKGGVDFFLLETCQDTRNVKAAISGIHRVREKTGVDVPIAVSVTIEPMGTMLAGQTVEALYTSLSHLNLLYLGLNCATGPAEMASHLKALHGISKFPIACVPNAGLPDEDGRYLETPAAVVGIMEGYARSGWLNVVGGCCGTTPAHVKAMVDRLTTCPPRRIEFLDPVSTLSGISPLVIADKRPYLVGERTNVIGSRKFKRLVRQSAFEEASEIARGQERAGAAIIDVCLSDPERVETDDVHAFYPELIKRIKAPIMIDSTDADSTRLALTYCQGKAIINSINLEDGLDRFDDIVPLAKRYGAALVVGCIDDDPEQGMALTVERKVEVARRSVEILTERFEFPVEDVYFDPLVFPCATGDENYKGSAPQTIEGIRAIKREFPLCKTILGISNVSFGLPAAGRETLNCVFLHHCVEAGLDLAIVNAAKYETIDQIPQQERDLCESLLWSGDDDAIAEFAAFYRKKKKVKASDEEKRTVEAFLSYCVIEGTKEGLIPALEKALAKYEPLEIINGPLMAGMSEVGRLFGKNELIVAEVLQSAEVMKASVSYLEPHMTKDDSMHKGKMLLATVKGDVHDIGKNLVDIIFSNNGFDVINLGIKVPPDVLIQHVAEHKPDFIGLSGLLVKSAQQMTITATALKAAGIDVPLMLGGAALTEKFTLSRVAPEYGNVVLYAKDAMGGLDLANRLMDAGKRRELVADFERKRTETAPVVDSPIEETVDRRRSESISVVEPPSAPDFERHVITNTPSGSIMPFLNQTMMFTKHLGFKGNFMKAFEAGDSKAKELWNHVEDVKKIYSGICRPKAIYRFFHAASDGNTISLYDADGRSFLGSWDLPRQKGGDRLCLADFVLPESKDAAIDSLCLFVVTAGEGVMAEAMRLKEAGEYLASHALQTLAVNTAEAYAEMLHCQLRSRWGFPDPPELTMAECFAAKYQGKRYSFGYPACPDMEGQRLIWQLLKPEHIGCTLSDGLMMEPEASVSAVVFHHPQAKYFSVG